MKIKILYILLLSLLCSGCIKNTSISDVPIDSENTMANDPLLEIIEPSSAPQPTEVIDEPLQETGN